jgi:hypothetical protein
MNVIAQPAKSRPFPKRKQSPIAAQATGSAETFVRYVVTRAIEQLERKRDARTIAEAKFPGDARLRTVIRATAEPPTSLSNTPALAVMGTDFVESLQPISAAAQLFRASRLMLNFDTYAAITIPDLVGLDEGPPSWVAEGQPAPVGELSSQATILEPYKLEFIVTVTREMLLGSNAEKLIGDALRTKIAFDMDKALFDALPADASRPAGLRNYNARLTESTSTSNETAMMQDVAALVGAAESIAGGEGLYLIGRTKRIMSMRQMYKILPAAVTLLPSAASIALPDSVLLGVVPRAVPSAIGLPEVELVASGAVEMDDAPGSTDLIQGANVRSFFQSDTFGLKVRLPASWGLRHLAGANWITCVWPSDLGGAGSGGLPDAPADGTFYGRHDGAWANVVEEAPATGAREAMAANYYVRHGSSGWTHLDQALGGEYAPLASPQFTGNPIAPTQAPGDASARLATTQFVADNAAGGIPEAPPDGFTYGRRNVAWQQLEAVFVGINSPQFTGTPSAPTPPPGDASTRLATTQFVADNAGAGGVEEVPAAPNGAYARIRTNATASWVDFVTLGVVSTADLALKAPLASPIFTGAPQAPTTLPNDPGFLKIVNLEVLAREIAAATGSYLPLTGGTLTGQLIAPQGGAQNNVALGFGDAATGFYRLGGVLVCSITGVAVAQFTPALSAFFTPVNMGSNAVSGIGDPAQPTDALNLRTGDTRYMRSGGPIISPPGTSPTDVGLGVGDAATGFYRQGQDLIISASGYPIVSFPANRSVALIGPLIMNTNPINNVGAPVAAADAATKAYVDALSRAPSYVNDPPAVVVPGPAWVQWWIGNYVIPRGGNSRILVSVAINVDQPTATPGILGVRCQSDAVTFTERHNFVFRTGARTGGISAQFFIDVSGATQPLAIQVAALEGPALTTLAAGDARSQILITDLGPV